MYKIDGEKWTIVMSNWGDSIACYGNICHLMEKEKLEKINIVYFGLEGQITEFLKHQKYTGRYLTVVPQDPRAYLKLSREICETDIKIEDWFLKLGISHIIDIGDVKETHVNLALHNNPIAHRYPMILPNEYENRWKNIITGFKREKTILIQPFSFDSTWFHEHWNYWIPAIELMVEQGYRIILVGSDKKFLGSFHGPKVLNLVGETQSMLDVFAIANYCDGIITTSNSLSMWSALTNKPTLVMKNKTIDKVKYFLNWINYGSNTIMQSNTSLDDFMEKVNSMWGN